MGNNRREFLKQAGVAVGSAWILPGNAFASGGPPKIRVLVWDERSDTEKEAYENFLGNCIADYLKLQAAFSVVSVALDDPEQGLSDQLLDNTDVLIWWGHVRQDEVIPGKGQSIIDRIAAGKLSLIALHSAHWSTPFVEAMNKITVQRALATGSVKQEDVSFIVPSPRYTVPRNDSRLTPFTEIQKFPDGRQKLAIHLPICCFPSYRNDGLPSTVQVKKPAHPVMKGIPGSFQISKTEMYNEPFHVPEPDEVIFEECWAGGEWFRSGMVWNLGKGKVFYFRPGHETFPVFKEKWPLQILQNAVLWLGRS
jgi:trehalose utilization protein